MRELIKICPKIQFFELSWCFLSMDGIHLVRKGTEQGVLIFQG